MWQVYEAYRRRFPRHTIDYLDIAARTLEVIRKQPIANRYDDIIVDESQDLTLIDLQIAQELLAAPSQMSTAPSSLMILADAAQTLYSRGFSWKQAGIQARGHTAILRKNYRNTHQIADAAAQLLKRNTILHSLGEYVNPEWTQRQAALPFLIKASSLFNSVELVRERILDLVSDQTFRLADFAVLCPTEQLCQLCEQVLKSAGLRTIQHKHPRFDLLDECIKIMPISSAKGLEFPVVFLMGLTNDLLPSRQGLQHADAEEARLYIEQQRALCYVGMTRAADALYLLSVKGMESLFVQELAGKVTLWQE